MYFQIIDNNEKCLKVFYSGNLVDYQINKELYMTWKHSKHLYDRDDIEYAYLYTEGEEIDKFCPYSNEQRWQSSSRRISAIMKSTMTAKCDLDNNCIYDFIPDNFLRDFLHNKEAIIKSIFQTKSKPRHYDILRKAHILTEELNAARNLYDDELRCTNYNIFGTKTGRLSNAKSEIPILTLKKEDRHLLKPKNDAFLELDFNAAELRTLLALSGKEQPSEDIHEWTAGLANVSREEIKKRTFAWLYNPEASDSLLEELYDRKGIKARLWDGNAVKTPFLREIEADSRRALNYIIQSTSSDVCIEQAFKLRELFKDCRTKLCYLMHDSVIIDFAKEDRDKFVEAKKIFGNTRFGQYRVNTSIGKNFGEMKKI